MSRTERALNKLTREQLVLLSSWGEDYEFFLMEDKDKYKENARGKIHGFLKALRSVGQITETERRLLNIYFTLG